MDCDYAPSDMEKQLPISYTLLRTIPSNDRPDCWLAKCEKPLQYGEIIINYIVFASRFIGDIICEEMKEIILGVAYVIDESLIEDNYLSFDKCNYVAICRAIKV